MLSPRLLLALAAGTLALLATPALAQDVPRQMVFQGRLVRADGSPENSPQDLRFAVYTTPTGGAPLWEESHPAVPVTNGYYAVVLGAAAPLPPEVFNGQALHLGVSLVGQSELTPRLPVVSVPYALKTGDSERVGGLGAASFARSEHSHPNATPSTAGFLSPADKAKLDTTQAFPTVGAGLSLSGGTLTANLTTAGGNNGTANTVARGDHRHAPALACLYRRASAAGGGQTTTATAYCAGGEVLSGGSCHEAETSGASRVFAGGEPTVATTTSAAQSEGGGGFRCVTTNSAILHSTAFCCRVTP